jgi:hypothetical protein
MMMGVIGVFYVRQNRWQEALWRVVRDLKNAERRLKI